MNLLDYIRSIVQKNYIKEIDSNYNQWGLNIYFSKYKNCIHYINLINQYNLTDKQHYDYLYKSIPMGWQKKLEFNKNKDMNEELENLCNYFNIKLSEAKKYIKLIDFEELKQIQEVYNV